MGVFDTPENERSFSALVDKVVVETGKPNELPTIVGFANLTIRECQALGLFSRDMREVSLTADGATHIYVRPRFHRSIRAVRYATQDVWPKAMLPGRLQQKKSHFFYSVDDSYVFKGAIAGEAIQLANYLFANPLRYFVRLGVTSPALVGGPYTVRPAYYDTDQLAWKYLAPGGTSYVFTLNDDSIEETRRLITENWLVAEWWDLLSEGVKAKVFKKTGDERAVLHFANYKQQQLLLRNTTGFEAEVGALVGGE